MTPRPPSPNRRLAAATLAALVLAVAGCDGDDGAVAEAEAPAAARGGPIAATAVAVGDCLNGIVLGAAERREITSAEVVPCEGDHALEVFATFDLAADDLDVEDLLTYPGPARVVRAADRGCTTRIQSLVEDADAFGVIALWPSAGSWASGDRTVACAVFSPDGQAFDSRQL